MSCGVRGKRKRKPSGVRLWRFEAGRESEDKEGGEKTEMRAD